MLLLYRSALTSAPFKWAQKCRRKQPFHRAAPCGNIHTNWHAPSQVFDPQKVTLSGAKIRRKGLPHGRLRPVFCFRETPPQTKQSLLNTPFAEICGYCTIAAHPKASLLGPPSGGLLRSKRVRYGAKHALVKNPCFSQGLQSRPRIRSIRIAARIIPYPQEKRNIDTLFVGKKLLIQSEFHPDGEGAGAPDR